MSWAKRSTTNIFPLSENKNDLKRIIGVKKNNWGQSKIISNFILETDLSAAQEWCYFG